MRSMQSATDLILNESKFTFSNNEEYVDCIRIQTEDKLI